MHDREAFVPDLETFAEGLDLMCKPRKYWKENALRVPICNPESGYQILILLPKAGGSIILEGAPAAGKGNPAFSVHAVSNAGTRASVRHWIPEPKRSVSKVEMLAPGSPPNLRRHGRAALQAANKEIIKFLEKATTCSRLDAPDEAASGALSRTSNEGGFLTGIELFVAAASPQIRVRQVRTCMSPADARFIFFRGLAITAHLSPDGTSCPLAEADRVGRGGVGQETARKWRLVRRTSSFSRQGEQQRQHATDAVWTLRTRAGNRETAPQ